MTIAEACLFGLGICGGTGTVPDIRFQLDGEYTSHQIKGGLTTLARRKPPAARVLDPGRPGYGHPSRWELTAAGRAWLDAECGPDDPGPVRVPCGVGWPA